VTPATAAARANDMARCIVGTMDRDISVYEGS